MVDAHPVSSGDDLCGKCRADVRGFTWNRGLMLPVDPLCEKAGKTGACARAVSVDWACGIFIHSEMPGKRGAKE